MTPKPLHIFTPAWGSKHLALMRSALGRSLLWPKNYDTVREAKWHLVSVPQDAEAVKALAHELLPHAEVDICVDPRVMQASDHGLSLALDLMKVMDICIKDNAPMLMATPDFVYGDGTIRAMMEIADQPGTVAGMAHIRVLPGFLAHIGFNVTGKIPTNAQLMNIAFKNCHGTWQDTQCGADPTMSYHCGVSWKWLNENTAAVQHHMPSPFLVNFISKDKDVWRNGGEPGFGFWDHDWPAFLLNDQRLRWIGSSDAAFMAEVTEPMANLGKMLPRNPLDPDAFFKDSYHCRIQRQFVSIFRGE